MSTKERQTELKKITGLEKFKETIHNSVIERHLDSFKENLDFARYFIERYEEGESQYNTISQEHDIALILKSNATAAIFIFKSALDCFASGLNKICDLKITENKVYFNETLSNCLEKHNYESIGDKVNSFIDETDYFFKLRNLITHNVVVGANYNLGLPQKRIKMCFRSLPDIKNMPDDLEVSSYCYALMDKIYELAEDIFKQLYDRKGRDRSLDLSKRCRQT